jgi:adenylate cyclase
LAYALVHRATARWCLGRRGWREDHQQAVAFARQADPVTHVLVVFYKYLPAIPTGVLAADDIALGEITEAIEVAERASDDVGLALTQAALVQALFHRDSADWDHAMTLAAQVLDTSRGERFSLLGVPVTNALIAWQKARHEDRGGALPALRAAVDELFDWGSFTWCVASTRWLVESLLADPDVADLQEAEAAIDRLADAPADDGFVARDIMLLRLRALLEHARDDEDAYRDYRDRYRAMAVELGFEGHMAWAEAMT